MRREMYAQSAQVEKHHWWYRGRGAIIRSVLGRSVTHSPLKILDIGCGTGGDFDTLSPFGEVTGVDYHEDAVAFCRQRGLQAVFQQDATALRFPDNTFDLTCCLDVLNGIENDAKAVEEAFRVTKKDGVVLFTVAANPALWGKTDVLSEHKRRYTRKTLLSLLTRCDYSILTCSYYNTILFPLAYVSRKVEHFFADRTEGVPGLHLPFRPVNAVLYFLFSFERHLLRYCSLPFGVSLLLLARKRA